MRFKSVNEVYNFDFSDSSISNFSIKGDVISFNLDALIIEPENSQNENYTKSFASTTLVRFENARIVSAIKDGYRRYDANNKLIEEVQDISLPLDEIKLILKNSKGAFLYAIDINPNSTEELFSYNISIEFANQDYETTVTNSYQFVVECTKAVFEWDNYLNKVQ